MAESCDGHVIKKSEDSAKLKREGLRNCELTLYGLKNEGQIPFNLIHT